MQPLLGCFPANATSQTFRAAGPLGAGAPTRANSRSAGFLLIITRFSYPGHMDRAAAAAVQSSPFSGPSKPPARHATDTDLRAPSASAPRPEGGTEPRAGAGHDHGGALATPPRGGLTHGSDSPVLLAREWQGSASGCGTQAAGPASRCAVQHPSIQVCKQYRNSSSRFHPELTSTNHAIVRLFHQCVKVGLQKSCREQNCLSRVFEMRNPMACHRETAPSRCVCEPPESCSEQNGLPRAFKC